MLVLIQKVKRYYIFNEHRENINYHDTNPILLTVFIYLKIYIINVIKAPHRRYVNVTCSELDVRTVRCQTYLNNEKELGDNILQGFRLHTND